MPPTRRHPSRKSRTRKLLLRLVICNRCLRTQTW